MSKRNKHKARKQAYEAWYGEQKPVFKPSRLPLGPNTRLVRVYVEGYEDVAFWRGIFDRYEHDELRFEVSVPQRDNLAKGKKVLMQMIPESGPDMLLCVDSDFDYLFGEQTEQSRLVNTSPYMFHTYAYAADNFLCFAPSLHNLCVRATKNDTRIFDFELFLENYSRTIYPLFLWYACSAQEGVENVFPLIEFRSSVKLNYLEVENNGADTLAWLQRQVEKRLESLRRHRPNWDNYLDAFDRRLRKRGVTPESAYLFMQGHTLMDNVAIVMLNSVCEYLKSMAMERITSSQKKGISLHNELSNYNNSLRSVRNILLENEAYKECFLYKKLRNDIERYIADL